MAGGAGPGGPNARGPQGPPGAGGRRGARSNDQPCSRCVAEGEGAASSRLRSGGGPTAVDQEHVADPAGDEGGWSGPLGPTRPAKFWERRNGRRGARRGLSRAVAFLPPPQGPGVAPGGDRPSGRSAVSSPLGPFVLPQAPDPLRGRRGWHVEPRARRARSGQPAAHQPGGHGVSTGERAGPGTVEARPAHGGQLGALAGPRGGRRRGGPTARTTGRRRFGPRKTPGPGRPERRSGERARALGEDGPRAGPSSAADRTTSRAGGEGSLPDPCRTKPGPGPRPGNGAQSAIRTVSRGPSTPAYGWVVGQFRAPTQPVGAAGPYPAPKDVHGGGLVVGVGGPCPQLKDTGRRRARRFPSPRCARSGQQRRLVLPGVPRR